jgi:hypothetical protein
VKPWLISGVSLYHQSKFREPPLMDFNVPASPEADVAAVDLEYAGLVLAGKFVATNPVSTPKL